MRCSSETVAHRSGDGRMIKYQHMDTPSLLQGKKILFVEDDTFFAEIMSLKLKGTGCEVHPITDAEHVLPALVSEKPDAVILDIMLPGGMDGFSLLQKIKEDPAHAHIPIIILSNLSREEDIEKGMKLGAFKYMTKAHVTPKDVVSCLEEAIKSAPVH